MIMKQPLCYLLRLTVWLYTFPTASSQVYTSSQKVEDMVLQEDTVLNNLKTEIINLDNSSILGYFTQFHQHRATKIPDPMSTANVHESLKHPNAIYRTIKEFKDAYQEFRRMLGPDPPPSIQKHLSGIANDGDVFGAWRSFLRIQEVYNLSPMDMVKGDYLGVKGPPLTALDAFEIGKLAFLGGKINTTLAWLEAAMVLKKGSVPGDGVEAEYLSDGMILALHGRSQIRLGHITEAEALYEQARNLEPVSEEVEALRQELESKPILQGPGSSVSDTNFTRLCSAHNKITTEKFDPRLSCSYRPAGLPYYTFKQELISNTPYICLFYDVITEYENQYFKEFATTKLYRSMVTGYTGSETYDIRISQQAYAWDYHSKVFASVSKRVGDITYLETLHGTKPFISGEPFQVVCYGMGGLYSEHMDTFNEDVHKSMTETLNQCGNRLATFLVYNMALFWYNLDPAGEVDKGTLHGGCPVVVGHKWVTNKWIWTYGNTFTRRCGLTQNATQLDIEEHMRRRWT